jgi:hypothetical protein
MYNKKTLTFTFDNYWGAFCQGAFVLDPVYIYLTHICLSYISNFHVSHINTKSK